MLSTVWPGLALPSVKASCFFAGLALLAGVDLLTTPRLLSATQSEDQPLEVTIKSASGKERQPLVVDGVASRTGLRPGQVVEIKLKPKGKKKGDPLTVSSWDGGIVSGHDSLAVSADGTAKFNFQAGQGPGLYRLLVEMGAEQYWLHFYVLDLNSPGKNPPRVRIFE